MTNTRRSVLVAERLVFFEGFRRGAQHALAQRDRPLNPVVDAIRTALGHGRGHFFDQAGRDGRPVEMNDAGDCAHGNISGGTGRPQAAVLRVTLVNFVFFGGMFEDALANGRQGGESARVIKVVING